MITGKLPSNFGLEKSEKKGRRATEHADHAMSCHHAIITIIIIIEEYYYINLKVFLSSFTTFSSNKLFLGILEAAVGHTVGDTRGTQSGRRKTTWQKNPNLVSYFLSYFLVLDFPALSSGFSLLMSCVYVEMYVLLIVKVLFGENQYKRLYVVISVLRIHYAKMMLGL